MKIRTSFVSNSSSSSFILGTSKKNRNKPIKVTIECDINDIIDDVIETEQQWAEYLFDEYCYGESLTDQMGEDKWLKERYEKGIAQLKAGNVLLVGSCSNEEDSAISQFIFDNKLKGNIDSKIYTIVEDAVH